MMKKLFCVALVAIAVGGISVTANVLPTQVEDNSGSVTNENISKAATLNVESIDISAARYPFCNDMGMPVTEIGSNFKWYYLDVTANWSNGTRQRIEFYYDYTVSNVNVYVPGEQVAVIKYNGVSSTISVYVEGSIDSLLVDTSKIKTEIEFGEELDLAGLDVWACFNNGSSIKLGNVGSLGGYSIAYNGFDSHKAGTYSLSVFYLDKRADFNVTVKPSETVNINPDPFVPTNN